MYSVPPISGGKRKPPKTPSPENVVRREDKHVEDDDVESDIASPGSVKAWAESELYSDIGSPSASSTTSEPLHLRTPGFDHHGHAFDFATKSKLSQSKSELIRSVRPKSNEGKVSARTGINEDQRNNDNAKTVDLKSEPTEEDSLVANDKTSSASKLACKKKKGNSCDKLICVNDIGCLKDINAPKLKGRKDPLPMKLRALPLSFWQQPNQSTDYPPAQCAVPLLPPLFKSELSHEVSEIRPVSPDKKYESAEVAEGSASSTRSNNSSTKSNAHKYSGSSSRIIKVTNTDLLMKLFDGLEEQKPSIVRRGRPKKESSVFQRRVIRGEDPCLGSVGGEGILPMLHATENRASSLVGGIGNGSGSFKSNNLASISVNNHGSQTVTILSVKDADNNVVSLPALSLENNYSQMLSELVVKL